MVLPRNILCAVLTQQEVVSQCFNIALAGFETTASALRFLTYHLAIHQDVQDKVLAEIQQVIGEVRWLVVET